MNLSNFLKVQYNDILTAAVSYLPEGCRECKISGLFWLVWDTVSLH